jgi:hypothetical protein
MRGGHSLHEGASKYLGKNASKSFLLVGLEFQVKFPGNCESRLGVAERNERQSVTGH